MGSTKLSNSAITSGTHTNADGVYSIGAISVSLAWDNFITVPPIPMNFNTTTAHATGSFNGWENPTYRIDGLFEEKSASTTSVHVNTFQRLITNDRLNSSTFTQTYLYDDIFAPDGIAILVDAIDFNRAASETDETAANSTPTTKGTLVRYSMTVRETL
jgi:hypothetical protein